MQGDGWHVGRQMACRETDGTWGDNGELGGTGGDRQQMRGASGMGWSESFASLRNSVN